MATRRALAAASGVSSLQSRAIEFENGISGTFQTTNPLSTSLLTSRRPSDYLRDHCDMDFSQSVMPTLLALAVIGTLLLVAFQAAA